MIGIPCHFRPTNEDKSACGIECPQISAYDGRDVNCIRCRKTKAWKRYMGYSLPVLIFSGNGENSK